MFTDIRSMLDLEEVHELLGYSVYPDPDRLGEVVEEYRNDPDLRLYGLFDGDLLLGIVGYAVQENRVIELRHIAVRPDSRNTGYGRGMILEIIGTENPSRIIAETDEDAADFYRNIGFTIESLGETYPGVERFRCTYDAEETEETRD